MKVLTLSLAMILVASSSFAMSLTEARKAAAEITTQTDQLIGTCDQVSRPAQEIKHKLADIGSGLNSFAPTKYVEDVLKNLSLGINAVNFSLHECAGYRGQDYGDGKNLLDMYLNTIDIDLMIAEHGIGADGKRAK